MVFFMESRRNCSMKHLLMHTGKGALIMGLALLTGCITPPPPPFIPLTAAEVPIKTGGMAGMIGGKKKIKGSSDEEIPPKRPAEKVLQPGVK
jgi:hypothetical protein